MYSNKQNNIYAGAYILQKTIPSKLVQTYRVDLTNLNLQGKRIFWGFAYQYSQDTLLYEKVCITSKYDSTNIYVSV